MEGIARALEDRSILAAIRELGPMGLAIGLLQWSSLDTHVMAIPWTGLFDDGDVLALAARIRRTGRLIEGGSTSLSAAMTAAVAALEQNDFRGERRVIDVSGDGRANEGDSPALPRAMAMALGITVNGLAILNEEPDLAAYFSAWVVGGPDSFLITADDYTDFAEAMRRKLFREISGPPIARAPDRRLYGARP